VIGQAHCPREQTFIPLAEQLFALLIWLCSHPALIQHLSLGSIQNFCLYVYLREQISKKKEAKVKKINEMRALTENNTTVAPFSTGSARRLRRLERIRM
jgi:hypothetical protein